MSQSRSGQRWNVGVLGALAIGGALAFCGDYALAHMRGDDTPRSNDTANVFLLNPNGKLQFSNSDAVVNQQLKESLRTIRDKELVISACNCWCENPPGFCCQCE